MNPFPVEEIAAPKPLAFGYGQALPLHGQHFKVQNGGDGPGADCQARRELCDIGQ